MNFNGLFLHLVGAVVGDNAQAKEEAKMKQTNIRNKKPSFKSNLRKVESQLVDGIRHLRRAVGIIEGLVSCLKVQHH